MKIKFNPNQDFQKEAIKNVVDLFDGIAEYISDLGNTDEVENTTNTNALSSGPIDIDDNI